MSDETKDGVDTVSKLYAESQRRKERNAVLRKELEAARAELAEIMKTHESLNKELETLRTQPDKVKEELTKIKGEMRTKMHKDTFAKVAAKSKIRPEAIEDLWTITKYSPEADDVNEEEISGLITEAVKDRPYLLATEEKPLQAGPGYSRGPSSNGIFTATESQLSDHIWMRDNQAAIREARKTNSFKILPG